jgi:AraC-like DNA-binding protein
MEILEEATPLQKQAPVGDWFTQACQMLTRDLHHKVDWNSIASEFGMSYHTFRFYFTRRAGMPPTRYRDQIRLRTACDYLTYNTHKSCEEIAFNLGYASLQHFSTYFKKRMELSPNEYRKKWQAKEGKVKHKTLP